jgi:hypothetical protein
MAGGAKTYDLLIPLSVPWLNPHPLNGCGQFPELLSNKHVKE